MARRRAGPSAGSKAWPLGSQWAAGGIVDYPRPTRGCFVGKSYVEYRNRRLDLEPAKELVALDSTRKTALVAGALYLLTFVSIPTLFLYNSVRGANYIVGAGSDNRVFIGVALEMIVALAGIGTAAVLFPVLKRQNEGAALSFVGVRTLEAAMIFVGAFSLLSVVALRQAGAGAGGLATGHALVSVHDWTFILGQSLIPAVNALLLGSLLYRSRLVPRILPVLGFIGAPILVASSVATLFGANHYGSSFSGVAGLPIAVWEFSLGAYLVIKGFRAAGLQQLGFEPKVPGDTTIATSKLRPAA